MSTPDSTPATAFSKDSETGEGGDRTLDKVGSPDDASTPDAPVEPPDAYVIPRTLAQATLDYLASHPYREVFALVRAFEALEPLPKDDLDRQK